VYRRPFFPLKDREHKANKPQDNIMKTTVSIDLFSLQISALSMAYKAQNVSPSDVIKEVYRRIQIEDQEALWTYLVPEEQALTAANKLAQANMQDLPLYGIPFSVKDNIHVEGMPTTGSCPAYSHYPDCTATVVQKLLDAGAILIGKNTMDQFATGLVGVRSPHHPVNSFNSDYIPGGSSSGSAVSVAKGLVSFSLGSDTGGSGRIPAALNNIVGLKPTPGLISTAGMVYANRSFDCVPIFALTCADAKKVFDLAIGLDDADPFMIKYPASQPQDKKFDNGFVIGLPDKANLTFFGDEQAEACFNEAIERIGIMGGEVREIDFSPFVKAGKMLFDGPFLAERFASVGEFIEANPHAVDQVVAGIIEKAKTYSAIDLVNEYYALKGLEQEVRATFKEIDALMVPTAGTIYKISEIKADPVALNATMGYYTYYANILRLSAIAVPAAIRPDGLPFGVCFVAEPQQDASLVALGSKWQSETKLPLGACPKAAT
jgi:allophanate hydrolase